jgi:hypothetical protein
MIALAAKAKYAGLKGDMGVAPNRIEVGAAEEWFRFPPCPVGAGETLGGEKSCFRGRFADPGCKLIVTLPVFVVLSQLKNKIIGNGGINRYSLKVC